MPYRSLAKLAKQLSTYYYAYGKLIATRTYVLLIFSLSFISYFSLPYITKLLWTKATPTTHNNIPLSQISTSLDAQCWHASAHVQFNNFSETQNLPPSHYLITERLRLSHPDQPVTFELIQQAKEIYTSISTTVVILGPNKQPFSLSSICYQHEGHCLIHAPPFSEFKNEQDWRRKTNIKNQPNKYESHPYSIYSNTTFDKTGEFIKADAVLLTFVLKQTQNGNVLRIWNSILQEVKEKFHVMDVNQHHHQKDTSHIWYASSNTSLQMIQYKFNLFPYQLSYKVQLSMVIYLVIFLLVSMAFGKSNLIKSGYTFGLAAVFLSIACFTTTWGIFIKLGISLNNVPWYLLLLSVNIGSLENVFLLTNAVLNAGCDMIVQEKVSRGLQSVGFPMTITLLAELLILSLGSQLDITLIKEFCLFTKVALCVDFILEMTFVIAVLSIDIKRVELADLDDRQMSKRLYEINKRDEVDSVLQPDFCPVQDTINKEDSKSCAECKDFKTHRALTALMLCCVVLGLSLFCSKESKHHHHHLVDKIRMSQPELNQLSDQFWSTVNPEKNVTWLQIRPAHLFIYDTDPLRVSNHVDQLRQLYLAKSMVIRAKIEHRPSLFRMFILSSLESALIFLVHINIPLLLLCLVTVGIITWMTPTWRDQWLLPLLINAFNQFFLTLMRWFPTQLIKRLYFRYIKRQKYYHEEVSKEYDVDGIHHRGAISVQNMFNQQQYRANVKHVQVRTLSHQHVADIQNLDANAKQSLVSCGEDGRLVLWNANNTKPGWMARLDKLCSARGQALLNPEFYSQGKKKKKQRQVVSLCKNKPRVVKVDQGNKWIAAGYEDGMIRIWNVSTGNLAREMELCHLQPSFVQVDNGPQLRKRFNSFSSSSSTTSSNSSKKDNADRILFMQFIGVITEFCHPLVAEAAARIKPVDFEASQNYIVSAHKSGVIHEWDILSGECIQTVKSGHTKDITQLLVVDTKISSRKYAVTWVFTASKDGTVKCWEHRFIFNPEDERTSWNLTYTIEQSSPVTCIAAELPVGGMGVLVTGCQDGSVRVWSFETGEAVCTLSLGKISPDTSLVDMIGGPIRKFSKLNVQLSSTSSSSSGEEDSDDNSSTSSSHHRRSLSDHRGAIYQVVVTRYCEVENGPGLCRGCDTCFGNGFLIASSSTDNKVHAWRLERSDSGHEGSCTLCTKDYHRKQYKHRKPSIGEDGEIKLTASGRKRRVGSGPIMKRRAAGPTDPITTLLDIEQLAGDAHIPLKPTFLGKIDQPGSRSVVFCDKILAGVRRHRQTGEWEAWFASLQYYDPTEEVGIYIPTESFELDNDEESLATTEVKEDELKGSILGLFSTTTTAGPTKQELKYKRITESDAEEEKEDEEDEASEILPFSSVRHIIPLDGSGLACDFGNFIKLVHLDKMSRTEKERIKRTTMEVEKLEELKEEESTCLCDENECSSSSNKECCGGVNENRKCCGGNVKKRQQEKRKQKRKLLRQCDGVIADCSLRNNCSRASDCVSHASNQAALNRWL